MSKFNISIETENNTKEYRQGDTVKGKVRVSVAEEVKCNGLTVSHQWHTHGRGNHDGGTHETKTLFSGTWAPGEYSYDFSLNIGNDAPPTYHGHYINIEHIIHGQADIPWKIDPRTKYNILVKRSDNPPYNKTTVNQILDMSPKTSFASIIAVLFLMIFGSIFAYAGYTNPEGTIHMLVGIGIIFFSIYMAFMTLIRNKMAISKLGDIKTSLSKSIFYPNDNAKLYLRFCPKKDIQINSIKATLKVREVAVSGSGTQRTTHTHNRTISEINIENSRGLRARIPFTSDINFNIPDDASPTFINFNNRLNWFVSVEIDIDNWPDWSTEKEIKML